MSLDRLPAGTRVLVDANIVVYHVAGASDECSRLLERSSRGEVRLTMAASNYSEMLHRLMISEARAQGLLQGGNPARRLRENPKLVASLSRYLQVEPVLAGCGLEGLDLTRAILNASHPLRQRYGLLVNDSLLAATAVTHKIGAVASADRDFVAVREFETYLPTDLS